MFPQPLRRLLKLAVVFVPVFVACNTITLLILQRGTVGLKYPSTPAHETEAGAQLPVFGVSPHSDRVLAHGKQHPEPEAAPASLEPETQPATTEVYDAAVEKDPKPAPAMIAPKQTHSAIPEVQAIDGGKQHPKPETTLAAPEQTYPAAAAAAAIPEVHSDVNDMLRETPKRPGTTRQPGTLSTQRVFNTSTTLRNNTPQPQARTQSVHNG
ncbi:hypothetical protein PG993_001858 [Apiospora rasikravindrae]|uniref:Uncharacterized protein n=1 Tax=Apiospora rasikravindrae TaxID=990691 RepID=A0ABR1UES9_9PEZI